MSVVSTHLMTNIKGCYDKMLARSQTITQLLLEGQHVDWQHLNMNRFTCRIDYIKVVPNTTNATQDISI